MTKLDKLWYQKGFAVALLLPFSWVFAVIVKLRRWAYRSHLKEVVIIDVPVIVVGNLTVGGTGKTPLVIWLVNTLRNEGYFPGIVTRGYHGQATKWPQQVRHDSDPVMVGDEAVLLARRCHCPVAAAPDRVAAARALIDHSDCDVIISDDGLQHYRLGRDIEIAVVDGMRRFGNEQLLPAGPLREPVERLKEVDFVVVNGGGVMRLEYAMATDAIRFVDLNDESNTLNPQDFRHQAVNAVAGIGNPTRFFTTLENLGIRITEHPFPDHHNFIAQDIEFNDGKPVLMTEKDAVKCRRFGIKNAWYLMIDARLDKRMSERLVIMMNKLAKEKDQYEES